jgi:DNA polymerase III alpha subunit
VSLFADAATHAPTLAPKLRSIPPPSAAEMLQWEKETLGIFVSGHPLADVQEYLIRSGATPIKNLRQLEDDAAVQIAGIVTSVRRTITKSGQQILVAQVEDTTASIEVIVFSKLYPQVQGIFTNDRVLIVKGRLRLRERRGSSPGEEAPLELSVGVNEVAPFERPARLNVPRPSGWHVTIARREHVDRLAALLDEWPGDVAVVMHAGTKAQRMSRDLSPDPRVRYELSRIFGDGNFWEGAP